MNVVDNAISVLKEKVRRNHPKFGITYTAVNTAEDSASGAIVSGVVNAPSLAQHLLACLSAPRCCAIAIANASGFRLVSPQTHTCSGTVRSAPFIIEHGFTGLIGAEKNHFSARGSAGVLTYELDGKSRLQIQIMWSVPNEFHLFDSWVNVSVGDKTASEELFKMMYKGRHGDVVKAKDTCRINRLTPDIRSEVIMSDGGRSTLVVKLFRE